MTRFNADDYGVCPAQCEAIRACRREGALTGVSVMPNSPYLAQAMAALAGDAALEVAVHLNVTEGLCLSKPEEVPRLAGADGRFRQTFFRLFIQGCLPGRKALKAQLKKELRAQLRRVWPLLDGRALRLDGHQHIQMAPIVLAALAEALAEEGLRPAYLRWSCEPLGPYLRKMSLWRDYRPVNIVKNLVLNLCGRLGRRRLRAMGLAPGMVMALCSPAIWNTGWSRRFCRTLKKPPPAGGGSWSW